MTSTARRMDQTGLDPRCEVPILQVVFHGPENIPGPRWPSEPDRSLRRRFWLKCREQIGPEARVSYAPTMLPADALRDAHRRAIPGAEAITGEVALFFIDPRPRANWAHPCTYVLMVGDRDPVSLPHRWPPSDEIPLRHLLRSVAPT